MSVADTARELMEAMQPDGGTQSYDTQATVVRVEDDTLWVHIPGGVDETPVQRTISASEGDVIQIRVGGGSAWAVGNASAPPTDDTMANHAVAIAETAERAASEAVLKTEEAGAFLRVMGDQIQSVVTELGEKNHTYSQPKTPEPFNWVTRGGDRIKARSGDLFRAKILMPPTPGMNITAEQLAAGDIWYDTGDGNAVYRWNGEAWVSVQDQKMSEISQRIDNITLRVIGSDGTVSEIEINDQGQINLLGTVLADRLNVDTLFAKDITATGVFKVNNGVYYLTQTENGFAMGPVTEDILWMSYLRVEKTGINMWTRQNANIGAYGDLTVQTDAGTIDLIGPGASLLLGISAVLSGKLLPDSTDTWDIGSAASRWKGIYTNAVDIGGYPAVARRTKTVSGTTSSSGYISLGLNANYGILSVRRTDTGSICWPYWSTAASGWYAHLATTGASPAAVASTAVTLEVEYYAK